MNGYKKKPLLIVFFSLVYLLNPIGNLVVIFLSDITRSPLTHLGVILNMIGKGNLVAIITVFLWLSAIPLAYGLFKVRTWAWYYFLAHATMIIIFSLFSSGKNGYFIGITPLFFINLLVLIPIGFFLQKEIRSPYLNPRLRWWEQSIRIRHNVRISYNDKVYETFDISKTGSFLIVPEDRLKSNVGDKISVTIDLDDNKVKCYSEVVWINKKSNEKLPCGIGIKFLDLSKNDKNIISEFIAELVKEGKAESR